MGSSRLALLTLPLLVPIACFQSSDDSMGAPDSSTPFADSGVDVSIPDAQAPFGDGGVPDTSVADVVIDVAPLPVTVRVVTLSGPEAGVLVVFDTAAGAVSGMGTTDATGAVTQVVTAGSQATVVLGTASSSNLVTIVGVEPGDVLEVVDTTAGQLTASITDVTNAATAPGGTASFGVSAGGCNTGPFTASPLAVPQSLYLAQGCYGATGFPIFTTAYDDEDAPLAYSWQTGTYGVVDAGAFDVTAGGTWSTATTTQSVTATNAPAGAEGGELIFSELSSGVAMPQTNDLPPANDGGIGATTFLVHTGFPSAIQTEIDLSGSMFGSQLVVAKRESAPTTDATSTIDLSTLLPSITGSSVDSTNPVQPTATWTSDGSFTGAAGILAQLSWDTDVDGSYTSGTWTIVVPATATSAPTPALPASVASFLPSADSTFFQTTLVLTVGGTAVPSYAALRSLQGSFVIPQVISSGPYVPALPANGTVVLSFTAATPG